MTSEQVFAKTFRASLCTDTAFRAFKKVWFEQSTPCPPSLSHPCYHTSACTALWDAGLTSACVSSAHSLPLLLNDCSNWFRRAERAWANWSVAAAAPFLVSPQIFSQFTSNIATHFYKLCKYEGEVGRTSSDGWLKSALLWKVLQFLLLARHWGEVAFLIQCSWKTRTRSSVYINNLQSCAHLLLNKNPVVKLQNMQNGLCYHCGTFFYFHKKTFLVDQKLYIVHWI